jgi:RNA polymerase sigma-54 factor
VEKSVEKLVDNPVNNSVENFSSLLISDFSVDKKLLEVLNKIQKFDPVGVICKNLQESLELQARSKLFLSENNYENEDYIDLDSETKNLILEILHSHFELLEKPRANLIQKKLNEKGIDCTLSQVETSLEFIRSLDPYPAREFSTENPIFIRPDVFIRRLSQEEIREANDEELKKYPFAIDLIKSNLPTIKISKDFLKYQNENSQTKKAVKEAKSFLEAIEQRNSTLIKVCVEIVKHQKDFFEKGAKFLKPLRLKDVAQDIGVHETTVSRISNAKYIQCEWGLFEVKYFFSNAVNVQSKDIISDKDNSSSKNQNSQEKFLSKESIKQELLSILQEEEGKNLSDQKLSDKLAQRGINIARRTVAKYRKELNFDSSYDR